MINPIYFSLMICAELKKLPESNTLIDLVHVGRISEALKLASLNAINTESKSSISSRWFRVSADLATLNGHFDEAHTFFQRSLTGVSGVDLAFTALHISALKALAKGDIFTAIRSYAGMMREQFDESQRCEGLAGMALLHLSLADIDTALKLAERMSNVSGANSDWCSLGRIIHDDVLEMHEWHSRTVLRDHVFWHWNSIEFKPDDIKPNSSIPIQINHDQSPLHALRRKQLLFRGLLSSQLSVEDLYHHYEWGRRELGKSNLINLKIEQALIAISRKRIGILRQILFGVDSESIMTASSYSDLQRLEFSYCFYKLYKDQGDEKMASQYYRNYLILSANRIRLRARVAPYYEALNINRTSMLSDDISARLPARHRRAYQYMLAHLNQNDLSVQDIANVISVSSRALQQAFKKYTGESPTEVLRRRRIEHVHGELLIFSSNTLIMDVAKRYGITNRTTLIHEYRKNFAALPSHTLKLGAIPSNLPGRKSRAKSAQTSQGC